MRKTEKLESCLEKLKKNKDNVPLEILKTQYKAGYGKLVSGIKAEAEACLLPIAVKLPPWLAGKQVAKRDAEEIYGAFGKVYRDGGYAKKIGKALYMHYSVREATELAQEVNRKYAAELEKIFHAKTCLYTTARNWDFQNPLKPRIYNAMLDVFWDEQRKVWVKSSRPKGETAYLLFVYRKEQAKNESNHSMAAVGAAAGVRTQAHRNEER